MTTTRSRSERFILHDSPGLPLSDNMSIVLWYSQAGRLKRQKHEAIHGVERLRQSLPYGRGSLPLDLEVDDMQRLSPRTLGTHPDPRDTIRRALRDPVDSHSIKSLISPGDSMTVIWDCQPGLANLEEIVPWVFQALGCQELDTDVGFIVSSTHGRSASQKAMSEISASSFSHDVVRHNPGNEARHVEIGVSPSIGNRILIDEMVVESDVVLSVSSVIQDSFTAATGGRMAILPGVSHRQTIDRNRVQQGMDDVSPFAIGTESCQDMAEASQMVGLAFSVNIVYDCLGNIASVKAGSPQKSWLKSVDDAKQLALAEYTATSDVVFVGAGGNPFDLTLYDAVDSLFAASSVCRRNGVIVLVAECA
ncbi:DUF2088 domain-containing protein, partial [Candidatus Thorarchaeota archaeon]